MVCPGWRGVVACAGSHVVAVAVIDFGKQHVITKDTVQVFIDALVYFRITDPRVAVLNIQVRCIVGNVLACAVVVLKLPCCTEPSRCR